MDKSHLVTVDLIISITKYVLIYKVCISPNTCAPVINLQVPHTCFYNHRIIISSTFRLMCTLPKALQISCIFYR